ncbi:MAG: hypothetical protein P8126_02650 [Gammaproteobacteria bacterium]|jgi:hypothetical protein
MMFEQMKRPAVTGLLLLLLLPAGGSVADAAVLLTGDPPGASQGRDQPAPAAVEMPSGKQGHNQTKKKSCMTVCARWGKECTYVNRGPGGTTKKCRRVCKQFTQECF